MNLNLGNFNESLRYSFQQFSKQDAEAREHSCQLLLRLDRFEAKALELGSRTRKALQIKNHYERILMHQHPLLWAHIQRGLVYNIGDMETKLEVSNILPTRSTKEMAINTSRSSSPSDQNSLHEAVWPNSPSPYPDETTEKLQMQQEANIRLEGGTSKENEEILQIGKLNITKNSEASDEDVVNKARHSKAKETEVSESINQQSFFRMEESRDLTRRQKEIEDYAQQYSMRIEEILPIHQQESPIKNQNPENQPTVTQSSWQNKPSDNFQEVRSPELHEKSKFEWHQDDRQETATTNQTKDFKPFQLDSESDCPDDPISGPLSVGKTGEGDDSDSFWG